MARSYFSKKGQGRPLDTIAKELSEDFGIEITEQDIVEHMEAYPNGRNDVYKEFKDENILPLQQRFTELTGLPANDKYIKLAISQVIAKEKLNQEVNENYLQFLSQEELLSLEQETSQYESARQKENTKINTSDGGRIKTKNTSKNEGESRSGQDGERKGKKDAISALFSKSPELKNIGSESQYSTYLESIFPDSKINNVVYHNSDTRNSTDKFNKSSDGIFFTIDKEYYGGRKNKTFAIVNTKNSAKSGVSITKWNDSKINQYKKLGFDSATARQVEDPLGNITEMVVGPDSFKIEKPNATKQESDRNKEIYDSEKVVKDNYEIVVFDPNQIHVLSSKSDIEGFEKFVNKKEAVIKTPLIPITVYHGGKLDGGSDGNGMFYVAKDKSQAKEYAKGNGGKVSEYVIDKSNIASEKQARATIKRLGLKSREEGLDYDEYNLYEWIDTRFDSSLSEKDINTLIKELQSKGFEGISFLDVDMTGKSRKGSENFVIFNSKKLINDNLNTLDKFSKLLDDSYKKLDDFGKQNLSSGIPIVIAKGVIKSMQIAVKTAKTTAEVIQAGLDYLKSTKWYKSLSKTERAFLKQTYFKADDLFNTPELKGAFASGIIANKGEAK